MPVIISPRDCDDIVKTLVEQDIYQFFPLTDCSPDIIGFQEIEWRRYLDMENSEGKEIVVLGNTLYSCFVYEYLKKTTENKVYMMFPQNIHSKLKHI